MTKEAADKVYLNYDVYSMIKEKSDSTKNYEYTDVNADKILNYANVDPSLRSKFGTAYKELFRHLHDSGLMYSFMDHTCKYASYLLHKEITTTHEYDLNTYDNFYYYVQKYYEYQKSGNKLCLNNMFYIDSSMLDKINALYGLYDSYTNFLKNNMIWNASTCDSLKVLVLQYNYYMTMYESTSKYLDDILKHFNQKVNDTIEKHKTKCERYYYNLEPIKLFVKPKVEQPIPESPKSPPEVNNHADTSNDNRETQLKGPIEAHMTQEVRRLEAAGETKQGVGTEQTVEIEQSTETELVPSASNNYKRLRAHSPNEPFRKLKLMHTVEPSEQSALLRESTFIPQTKLKNDEGFFSNMQSTLSSIVHNVDPAPVLGVSGGMGVLFVLFKYTPVGSFFGGRRGRFRQIPRSFNGPFPGYFGNFQEYGGGYVGYSQMDINPLAE
ncbi:hypothetical protein PVC01_000090900 [Plasmodium vivax]|uniref:VIR protein n=1 Tax=Plasmodium vivax TaxID=5855 RepID=A0A1G4E4C7_PLAVI|nr:hypothetical protein PVC01_000090900 [Plasmodium vivax]